MLRSTPLATGEMYHCFNRGAHKQDVFTNDQDYRRFQLLLYVANTEKPVHLGNLLAKYKGPTSLEIFRQEYFEEHLVDVLGYCLMPNHFHLILQQKTDDGITKFMRKLGTAYSMYFNKKYDHSGVVFQGKFKNAHVSSEPYFRYIFSYVHLNPLDLLQPDWKEHGLVDKQKAREFLRNYRFSSHYDLHVSKRPESVILSNNLPDFVHEQNDMEDLLAWQSDV